MAIPSPIPLDYEDDDFGTKFRACLRSGRACSFLIGGGGLVHLRGSVTDGVVPNWAELVTKPGLRRFVGAVALLENSAMQYRIVEDGDYLRVDVYRQPPETS